MGELAVAGERGGVRSREVQTHLTYWRRISRQGYRYPDVAWAISAVETGYWWSEVELARHGHNLFGMKKNGRGYYTSVSPDGYCRYASPVASLDDYGDYEAATIRKYSISSRAEYLAHICWRFCPNPSYGGKLALAFQKLKRIQPLA
ncbi:glucosaminidase domain-containing protein [Fibrella sp. WM1]|uniref:glucosaminidase domain-containing protein n=1 Tax=Fibrella musci TaxID=3242485 RepID=UPI003522C12F